MDHESLRTASTYLNNLLLARGLLRNSDPIDFVKPSKESRAQIINLVHDLILREDRSKEQREHVAITLRNMRADESRRTSELEKLKEKREESARAAVQAQAAERNAKDEAKKVERAMKSLQEQTARLKTTLAQVKTQCANDVRKRDLELTRLKTHLQGQQRGNRVGMTAPSITISRGAAVNGTRGKTNGSTVHDVADPEYSLKQETTDFLTQLSQSLSDENDSLIALIRGALITLKEVLGLPATSCMHPDSAVGSMGSYEESKSGKNMMQALPTSYETLASDMETTLSHLRGILNNPNFVTVEEVEVREEEIARLREGWERMEQRWRDVLSMMDGWRRRMDTGDTINIDDLRRGMGLVSPERERNGLLPATHDLEPSFVSEEGDASEIKLSNIQEEDHSTISEPSTAAPTTAPAVSSPRVAATAISNPRNRRIYSEGATLDSPKRKRDILDPPEFFDLRPSAARQATSNPDEGNQELDEMIEEDNLDDAILPHDSSDENSEPHLTIAEKLHAAQAEAEEAAAAANRSREHASARKDKKTHRQVRVSFGGLDGTHDAVEAEEERDDDTLGKIVSPVKKTKIRGRPKRRKSTLSPEELEELMMVADG